MIFQNKFPKKYCGEVVLTASYLINHLPYTFFASKTLMKVLSPFYHDMSTSSNLTHIIFGCTQFVHIHNDGRRKLDPRTLKCVFIGYSSTKKGYKCYHLSSHKYFVFRDVTFHKQKSYFLQSHLQGENISKEDASSLLPDLTFEPEVETETSGKFGNMKNISKDCKWAYLDITLLNYCYIIYRKYFFIARTW